jgi:hypothetical protein
MDLIDKRAAEHTKKQKNIDFKILKNYKPQEIWRYIFSFLKAF